MSCCWVAEVSQAKAHGPHKGQGHSQANIATHSGVRLRPAFFEVSGETFASTIFLRGLQTIHGENQGSEFIALCQAVGKVFLLVGFLLLRQDLGWLLGPVGLCICICHADVEDGSHTTLPESMASNVTAGVGWNGGVASLILLSIVLT